MAKATPRRPITKAAPAPPPKKPIGKWILYGIIGAAVLALVIYLSIPPEKVPDGIPEGTQSIAVGELNHVDGPIDYGVAVPAGGSHNPIWLNCGIYDVEVPAENAVHALEHGAVWITYRPDVGQGAIDTLAGVARTRSKAILSPVPDQASPIMATAWGWQLELTNADDIRLRQFILSFEGASSVPEPGARCVGGVGA